MGHDNKEFSCKKSKPRGESESRPVKSNPDHMSWLTSEPWLSVYLKLKPIC